MFKKRDKNTRQTTSLREENDRNLQLQKELQEVERARLQLHFLGFRR